MKIYELYNQSARVVHVFGKMCIPGQLTKVPDPQGILEASIDGSDDLKIVNVIDAEDVKNKREVAEESDGKSGTNAAIPGDSKGDNNVGTAGMGSQGEPGAAEAAAGTSKTPDQAQADATKAGSSWTSPAKSNAKK